MPLPAVAAAAAKKAAAYAAKKAKERLAEEARRRAVKRFGPMVGGGALLLAPVMIMLMALLGAVGAPPAEAANGSCATGTAIPSSAEIPPSAADAINALKADYEAVGAEENVAWSLLAAIDYRESGNSPDRSMLSGEVIGTTNPDSGAVTSSKRDSITKGAQHLKAMASSVYGVNLTSSSGGEDVKLSALAYNRGFIYKRVNQSADTSPYVMNQYDASHTDMVWPSINGEPLAGITEYGRLGAFTLFTRLGGSAASCGLSDDELVRIAQQQLGLKETPDGCNCGDQIQKFLGSSGGEEWCADFVSWVYNEAGRPFTGGMDGGWRVINVGVMHQWHVDNGLWFPAGSAEDPRAGDVITFNNDGHVGMVERLDDAGTPGVPGDDVIYTIEGNTSDMVARRDYRRVGDTVVGWGRRK